jgi:hypothetical protein
MTVLLARVLGFLGKRNAAESVSSQPDVTNEVSEHEGTLLVRLGHGSAMQVRRNPDRATVLVRVVPIAKATHLEGDSPWQVAPDSQLRTWIAQGSAIGQWLLSKG